MKFNCFIILSATFFWGCKNEKNDGLDQSSPQIDQSSPQVDKSSPQVDQSPLQTNNHVSRMSDDESLEDDETEELESDLTTHSLLVMIHHPKPQYCQRHSTMMIQYHFHLNSNLFSLPVCARSLQPTPLHLSTTKPQFT
jgi:hypothetical protein